MSGSPRGVQIFRLMEIGELVPTIIVLHLLTEAMVTTSKYHMFCKITFQFFRLKRSMEVKQRGFCSTLSLATLIR